ncbi:dienelactone hydrolase family protein [Variovorax sp. NFACC27]|uniref:alpha/beta hydrolase n=1 Tax=unclassified Variovorax TaxID=663243 RepID=UPI0008948688|nr:phospholipase/carboxylesterase [Variovorax sp. NFACC28]SEG28851.1 phospholipase/carboxylesterase [Variovorax sp. NFACC29]SFC43396.1 phospholipase/carboxylesterase [Variovorax sp. NFACC26]SFF91158.1 phospholipase/carboxylesterase [Variovorax sp. NFACC27]
MSRPPIEIETAPNPTATVIVMHGLGADGNDFVPIAGELDLSAVGPVRFVFPNAPVMPVTINGGYQMPAWYDIVVPDLEAEEDEAGLRRSQATVEAVIAGEKARGIAADRIVVAGFSQGCAMALMTGLRHTERLAGIVGLSGYLPIAATTAAERHAANHETPVFLAHGRQDPVVPYAAAVRTREALGTLGYAVEWHEYTMAHSVCMEEVADLNRFLLRVLG